MTVGEYAGAVVVSVEEEVVSVALEDVSVEEVSDEGVLVVSLVEALPAVVSVPVMPTIDRDSPNAPEAMRPKAKRTASPRPIRSDRFRSVRRAVSVPRFALFLKPLRPSLVKTARASHDRRHAKAGQRARRSGQARNCQLAAEIPLRSRTKVPLLRLDVKHFLYCSSGAAGVQLAEGTDSPWPIGRC